MKTNQRLRMLTPRVVVAMFAVSGNTQAPVVEQVRNSCLFLVLMYSVLALRIFIPSDITTLPRALGY